MVPDIVEIKRLCSSGQWLTRIENGKVLLHDTVSGETVCVGQTSAEPVRHGVWNENITFNKREYLSLPVKRGYVCSLCDRKERKKEPYCHCGAKMDAEVEGC